MAQYLLVVDVTAKFLSFLLCVVCHSFCALPNMMTVQKLKVNLNAHRESGRDEAIQSNYAVAFQSVAGKDSRA